jgi:hypothetical protein
MAYGAGKFGSIRTWVVALGYLAVGAGGGYLLAESGVNAAARVDGSEWVRLPDAGPTLALHQPPFAEQPHNQTGHAHPDGTRSNWATFGTLADWGPNVTVQVVRRAKASTVRTGLLQNLAAIPEIKTAPHRFGSDYYVLTTRLGDLRAINFQVIADGVQKACLGFHKPGHSKLFVKGFFCWQDVAQVDAKFVACLLDHLRFVRPADEEAANARLAEGEAKECGAAVLDFSPQSLRSQESTL